jgi:hypothetical protein
MAEPPLRLGQRDDANTGGPGTTPRLPAGPNTGGSKPDTRAPRIGDANRYT